MKCGHFEDVAGFVASVVGAKSIDLEKQASGWLFAA